MVILSGNKPQYGQRPFPHATINPFFTQETYQTLLDAIPPKELYCRDSYHKQDGLRYSFWPSRENHMLSPEHSLFWAKLHEYFCSRETIESFITPFTTDTKRDAVLRTNFDTSTLAASLRLVREYCPFVLPPHIDMPTKVLVVLVYLDTERRRESNGTTLYSKNRSEFTPVKVIPYHPNAALLTPRTSHSWHGGEWKKEGTRDTLHIYYFQKDRLGHIT